ncbi:MAG: hypothetical protein HYY31_02465, partial [Chloroflexi bacterium]|nr:hypothetical protein [Chloroflexota bacterium]
MGSALPERVKASPPPKLEALQRILRLEQKRGYDNRAVLGGLEGFIIRWRADLEAAQEKKLLSRLHSLRLFDAPYASWSSTQRHQWVDSLVQSLDHLAKATGLPPSNASTAPSPRRGLPQSRASPSGLSINSPVTLVRGVGSAVAERLKSLGVRRARDLLYHFPRRHLLLSHVSDLTQGLEQAVVANVWEVRTIRLGERQREAAEAVV